MVCHAESACHVTLPTQTDESGGTDNNVPAAAWAPFSIVQPADTPALQVPAAESASTAAHAESASAVLPVNHTALPVGLGEGGALPPQPTAVSSRRLPARIEQIAKELAEERARTGEPPPMVQKVAYPPDPVLRTTYFYPEEHLGFYSDDDDDMDPWDWKRAVSYTHLTLPTNREV